jgi:nucleotide-binding universal stress UspA family protein
MKKILVPVDFSDHTRVSCAYAAEFARATGAEIILFHSFFEQVYFSDGGFATGFESGIMLTDEIIHDFYEQKKEQLNKLADKIKAPEEAGADSVIKVTAMIETGDPQAQILSAIDNIAPDLVIMGSSGLGKKGFLLGSVAKRIMNHTETPVMAIPDINVVKEFKNILYVTDFEQEDLAALQKISQLFKKFGSTCHCLHLDVNDKDRGAEIQMVELSRNKFFEDIMEKYRFNVLPCHNAQECLKEYIDKNEIDLIAFIPHKKNFLSIFSRQDLTKEDLFETGLPILGVLLGSSPGEG